MREEPVQINTRVSRNVSDALAAIAAQHDRSIAAELRQAIRAHLERHELAAEHDTERAAA